MSDVKTDEQELEIRRDTAVWSNRQWFVGHTSIAFSSEEDAKQAVRLARAYALTSQAELADKIRSVLP